MARWIQDAAMRLLENFALRTPLGFSPPRPSQQKIKDGPITNIKNFPSIFADDIAYVLQMSNRSKTKIAHLEKLEAKVYPSSLFFQKAVQTR